MNSSVGFELHGLQKLFATSVTAVQVPGCFVDPGLIHELVIAETARVKHRLIENALIIEGEDAVRRYVRIHQYSIVAIMDKLFRRRDQPGTLDCCDVLDGLLTFLSQHFPQYFDEFGKAPLKHIHEMQIDIGLSFGLLERKLLSICTLTPFVYMVLDPLHRFYSKGVEQRVTFNRLRYLGYILEHSRKVVQDKQEPDPMDDSFLDLMVYLNYNSRKSYMQLVQFLRDLLPYDLDIDTKRESLEQYLKITIQAMVKPNTGYHPHAPTLKSQFIDHLNAELHDLVNQTHFDSPSDSNPEPTTANKAKFDLSVAQLGCLLRLLTETGIVSTENISALIRGIALNCETKKSRSISPESLQMKFYDIEEGTRRSVKEKLANLLKSAENI